MIDGDGGSGNRGRGGGGNPVAVGEAEPVRFRLVYTATAVFDLLLPTDARSLKAKRSYVRPIVAALRKFEVAAAEVGALELHGRTEIGVAAVASDAAHARAVVESCEHLLAGRPEIEILSARHQLIGADD